MTFYFTENQRYEDRDKYLFSTMTSVLSVRQNHSFSLNYLINNIRRFSMLIYICNRGTKQKYIGITILMVEYCSSISIQYVSDPFQLDISCIGSRFNERKITTNYSPSLLPPSSFLIILAGCDYFQPKTSFSYSSKTKGRTYVLILLKFEATFY